MGNTIFYSKFIQRSFFYAIELLRAGAIITNTKKFIASNLKVHFHLWKNNAYTYVYVYLHEHFNGADINTLKCLVLSSRDTNAPTTGERESCPLTGASHNDGMSTNFHSREI